MLSITEVAKPVKNDLKILVGKLKLIYGGKNRKLEGVSDEWYWKREDFKG